ncbi:MAG: helix-turn-helix transcriptional regulator [Chloroflexi bacterium]|nr:helix-turn-helix transcriptional regulator [Chloroflexota bacterium]MBI3167382.1 helix-turn-helix transcriptional regulator [Chloroflexota bacterium]
MSIIHTQRLSDSPYVEAITQGWTMSAGSTIRPSECNWHMVFVKEHGRTHKLIVGPLPTAGVASWGEGAEILWIKFKLGVFMPHLPVRDLLDSEKSLPEAASKSFWLKSAVWELPDFENVDTFVNRLVHDEILVLDPVVDAMLQDQLPDISSRTMRHHFLRATGLTRSRISQMKQAQQAMTLLQQGVSILDAVHEAGYFDQPHLTRALKQFIGYTPAQIAQSNQPE